MKDNKITIIKDNEEQLATIIISFTQNNKNYVIFEFDESEEVSAAIYEENNDTEGFLSDIQTQEEWEMIQEALDNYYDELEDLDE